MGMIKISKKLKQFYTVRKFWNGVKLFFTNPLLIGLVLFYNLLVYGIQGFVNGLIYTIMGINIFVMLTILIDNYFNKKRKNLKKIT